jgi:hypothetical protein
MNAGRSDRIVPGQDIILIRDTDRGAPVAQSVFISAQSEPFTPAPATPRTAFPVVRARWGIAGGVHTADFDCKNGTIFSVVAQSLSVEIAYPAGDGPAVLVGASVSDGLAQHDAPTRTALFTTLLAAATSARFAVPAYASSLIVYSDTAATNLISVRTYGSESLAEVPVKTLSSGSGAFVTWPIALQNQDIFCDVVNGTAGPVNISALFAIGL